MNKIRVFEITPSSNAEFDTMMLRVDSDSTWRTLLETIERTLDQQWTQFENGERNWKDISIKVTCKEVEPDELREYDDY